VQQVVSQGATFTAMRCSLAVAPAQNLTYTFRINAANASPGLTCTILAGATVGTGSGSATVSPGDRIDVLSPAAGNPGAAGSFSFS
jgi:hypothetical protein